ncbi:MAG: hypothetical protein K6F35_11325 [Lachnospiraceae bacterium]|nr:hypothetical protein [Lachnospiraceae bacterium]
MNEKAYKSMGFGAVAALTSGIIVICIGIAVGILMIVSGARLLHDKTGILF